MYNTRMNNYVAYTDGASSGNPGPSGWAVLINGELLSGWVECATNNQMELFAAYQALDHCPAYEHLTIVSDSKLAIGMLSKGWQTKVQHLQDIVDAFQAVVEAKEVTVAFLKVKGHSNSPENGKVDRAAVAQTRIAKNATAARSQSY